MPSRGGTIGPPIVFGEVLFDRFPDGEVLGGAPFNVAWHLQGFGESPLLVSRVGDDERGRRVRDAMGAWGLTTDGLGVDSRAPTGLVDVKTSDDGHAFDILPDRAYDRIAASQMADGTGAPLICHGTLALRTEAGRKAIRHLRESTGAPFFCDLNLRPPWSVPEAVEWSLAQSEWLKLNDEELARVSGRSCDSRDECRTAARAVLDARDHRLLYVTRGKRGALVVARDGIVHVAVAPPVEDFVDSVGAGDAFTAVAILGQLRGWPLDVGLERAVGFAARICAQRGATSSDRSLYREFLRVEGDGDV